MPTTLKSRANLAMPGGVNSPVRAFKGVDQDPIFARRGQDAYLETDNHDRLIDFCMSFGPLILGHAHPDVVQAIQATAIDGTSFAVTTQAEIEIAELIQQAIPSMERVRMVNSGTEACMTAIRLARGATGRNKIVKFSGCYHGHADCLLVHAGSGVAGIANASSAGVTEACVADTLVAPYNDLDSVVALFDKHGKDIAALLVEPVAANMGLVIPDNHYLQSLSEIAKKHDALLIFDEVITGFRFTFGGYQRLCDVTPDLTILGKIIGGGMPVGAFGGRVELMDHLAPLGPVYQAGTLSGNPISMASGLATLRWLQRNEPYKELADHTARFVERLQAVAHKYVGPNVQIPNLGSLFCLFFSDKRPTCFEDVIACEQEPFKKLFQVLLTNGVYLPPSPFEVSFVSTAHKQNVLDQALEAFERAFKKAFG